MSQGNAAAGRRRVKNIEPPRPGSSNDLNATSTQSPSSNPSNLSNPPELAIQATSKLSVFPVCHS